MGFCDGMMFCFRSVWKKRWEFFQVTTKRKNKLYCEICFKQVSSEWMDGEALSPWTNDGFCCFGNPSREWKACKFEIRRNISVKISAKLIRNFKKKTYDEINAKIFGDPFSLLTFEKLQILLKLSIILPFWSAIFQQKNSKWSRWSDQKPWLISEWIIFYRSH